MASVSGATSSLGNTSLRGFGGLASGIDRDGMIEAMTAGTQSKIDSQKSAMTKLQWKQEAYREIIDQIIDIEDQYFSFTSGSNLKSSALFAKNIISTIGDDDVTKFVKASGSSAWVDNLSIQAVEQLATASTQMSAAKGQAGPITTDIGSLADSKPIAELLGKSLAFGYKPVEGENSDGKFNTLATFTFPGSYITTENGEQVTKYIDYTQDLEGLVNDLNSAIDANKFKIKTEGDFHFEYNSEDGKEWISIKLKDGSDDYAINTSAYSSALKVLGNSEGMTTVGELNAAMKEKGTGIYTEKDMLDHLKGQSMTISYGGETRTIDLLTTDDYNELRDKLDAAKKIADPTEKEAKIKEVEALFEQKVQGRIDKAFGKDKVAVTWKPDASDPNKRALSFQNADKDDQQTLTINTTSVQLRTIMGIQKNQSNKLTVAGTLEGNLDKLGLSESDFDADGKLSISINGTEIEGITKNTTINELIDKINSTKGVGVKASYLSGGNQFLLVATETGRGRQIDLGGTESAASKIFGNVQDVEVEKEDGTTETVRKETGFTTGKDATIRVSYGNGVSQTLSSSTNTFNIEGLNVTVSGTFGYLKDADGEFKLDKNGEKILDTTQSVSFSAKANVDKATEQVKAFFEAYNKVVTQVGKEVRTRPDRSFGPLTDAQKDEMDEKSIENWEKKAKEGILFNDSAVQNFSTALENVMTSLMRNGISYKDLEKIGVTMSDDFQDGGKIIFDEAKFKSAMETDPELVSNIFTGGGSVRKGLAETIEDTLTPYATRYRSDNASSYGSEGSYGRLIEEAGSEKVPLSVSNNWIYTQLKQMEDTISTLKTRLKSEQDRYIKQFTSMETMINKFNSQSSYLSQFQG